MVEERVGFVFGGSWILRRPIRHGRTCARKSKGVAVMAAPMELASIVVGYSVLAGSMLYKLPQVLRVATRKRGQGISLSGLALETVGISLAGAYSLRRGFPFSSFGETLFIPLQNVAIMALVVKYVGADATPWMVLLLLYLAMCTLLMQPVVGVKVLALLNVCATPISYFSRVPQLVMNWRAKSTGELAPVTLALQLLGNIARIFTTIIQVRDPVILISFMSATILNGALFLQWWYYSKKGDLTSKPRMEGKVTQ